MRPVPVDLQLHCRQLIAQHGSSRKAAEELHIDHAYLWNLAHGKRRNPSVTILRRLGLRKETYVGYYRTRPIEVAR